MKELSYKNFTGTTEIYSADNDGVFEINYRKKEIIDYGFASFTGLVYSDLKYKLFRDVIFKGVKIIITDSDLIAHDSYIEVLNDHVIIFVNNEKAKHTCSKLRVKKAYQKLKDLGFSCIYRDSIKTGVKELDRQLNKLI